jgi:hypothetical protein
MDSLLAGKKFPAPLNKFPAIAAQGIWRKRLKRLRQSTPESLDRHTICKHSLPFSLPAGNPRIKPDPGFAGRPI